MFLEIGSPEIELNYTIKKVSKDHGEVLEGFGQLQNGMPIRIQYKNS